MDLKVCQVVSIENVLETGSTLGDVVFYLTPHGKWSKDKAAGALYPEPIAKIIQRGLKADGMERVEVIQALPGLHKEDE